MFIETCLFFLEMQTFECDFEKKKSNYKRSILQSILQESHLSGLFLLREHKNGPT